MSPLKRILIVEDYFHNFKEITDYLGSQVEVIWGKNQEEARELFFKEKDSIDLVIMDACVPGSHPNTMDLIGEIKACFQGPIIAVSSVSEYIPVLMKAGATHKSTAGRWGAAKLALQLLSLDK
ncbi:hypothetical protein ACFL08_02060 [Patescibacteria group bacterium]